MADDPLVGKRIELLAMPNDPAPIEVGEKGTVSRVVEIGGSAQISVEWDSGRALSLVVPPDRYRVISDEMEGT